MTRTNDARQAVEGVVVCLEESVEADVSLAFAWRLRTDVGTWNDPPATFALDGPFAVGSRGTTMMPGQEPVHWRIAEVRPREMFAMEMLLDGATLRFEWRFDEIAGDRTRMTQSVLLSGPDAPAYNESIAAAFGPTLAPGMAKIAAEMTNAYARRRD